MHAAQRVPCRPGRRLRHGSAATLLGIGALPALLVASASASDTGFVSAFGQDWRVGAAVAIFAATYLVIAIGKLPGYRLDRAGAALLGAALMVGLGVLPLDAAVLAAGL